MSWRDYIRQLMALPDWWDHDSAVRREANFTLREEHP